MSKPLSKAEVAEMFMEQLDACVSFWLNTENTEEDKMWGLVHSILVIFDGGTSLPAMNIIPRPHPSDKDYCIANDQDYFVEEPFNDNISLHDMWSKP